MSDCVEMFKQASAMREAGIGAISSMLRNAYERRIQFDIYRIEFDEI